MITGLLSLPACKQNATQEEKLPPVHYKAEDLRYFTGFTQLEPLLKLNNDTTYVFNFWATWCKPCVKELPLFEKVWRETRNEPVKIVLISLDFPNETEQKLVPFLNAHALHPEIWVFYDSDIYTWMPKVDETWIDSSIPATLIRRNGKRLFHLGAYPDYQTLMKDLTKVQQAR